jgi:hypothetical protein
MSVSEVKRMKELIRGEPPVEGNVCEPEPGT